MPISPSKSRDLADENNKIWRNGNDSKQPYSDYPFGIIKLFLYHNVKHTLDILSSFLDIASWMYFICSGVDGLLYILVIQISHLQIIVFMVKD
jgi:hypothetical protein